ncbi:MAG TPA: FAD:protein FMN transferase [Candidatus Omnitrophota bacterium]|nr:FAD:protein FMN transferase [Candidatus Omnitrophota bacterium]
MKLSKENYLWAGIILGCLVLWAATGRKEGQEKYSETKYMMGTYVQIDTCASQVKELDIQEIYKRVWERLEDIAWRMNVFDERSDVAKINQAYEQPVEVGADTYKVIQEAIRFNQLTRGAFDITVWPLIQLWKDAAQKDSLPAPEAIAQVKRAIGAHTILLFELNNVQLTNPTTKVDLGGIAAGYAIDEAARIFRDNGVHSFFIDAGGDIYAGGNNCKGQPWRVGIRDPKDRDKFSAVVLLKDASVTTSGNYEKYFEIQGKRYSHIFNPVTGYPQEGVVSATAIAPTGLEADALATALTVLGREEGVALMDQMGPSYAGFIIEEKKGKMEQSPSLKFEEFRLKL